MMWSQMSLGISIKTGEESVKVTAIGDKGVATLG